MASNPDSFQGFPPQAFDFLRELRANNSKTWFEANKSTYQAHVVEPSRSFVNAMGARLTARHPQVIADPKVNRSLFRINRDTRFSKDKTPYKTNVAFLFWDGTGKRMTTSAFYLHMTPEELFVGAGIKGFDKPTLASYRNAVVNDAFGAALGQVIAGLKAAGPYELGEQTYKRVPRGFDKDHPRGDLLRFSGLVAHRKLPMDETVHSTAIIDVVDQCFQDMAPLHEWLVSLQGR